jgi:hypothetical protein
MDGIQNELRSMQTDIKELFQRSVEMTERLHEMDRRSLERHGDLLRALSELQRSRR